MTNPSLRAAVPSIVAALVLVAPDPVVQGQAPSRLHGLYTIQQSSNGRYLDAYLTPEEDFAVVTRLNQNDRTQRWILTAVEGNTYRIQQLYNHRYLDAHDTPDKDFRVVTRPGQANLTQLWALTHAGGGAYTIQQRHTRRFLDAHEWRGQDFGVVTRPTQFNQTQKWVISRVLGTTHTPPPPSPQPPSPALPPSPAPPSGPVTQAAGTCSISGRVVGDLQVSECVDAKCTIRRSATLRRVILYSESPRLQIAEDSLMEGMFSFPNVRAGRTYVVLPTAGWMHANDARVECEAQRSHRVVVRVRGYSRTLASR